MDELTYLSVGVLVLLTAFLLLEVKRKRKLPPGPAGLPLLGYYPFLGKKPEKTISKLGEKYGNIFGFYIGRQYAVVLNNWDALVDAYKQNSTLYRPDTIFGEVPFHLGVAGANGAEWQLVRRLMMKAFKDIGLHRTRWEELTREKAREISENIMKYGTEPLDLKQVLEVHFANAIMSLVLGQPLPEGHPLLKVVTSGIDQILERTPSMGLLNFSPKLLKLLQLLGIEEKFDLHEKLENLTKFVVSVTDEKMKNSEKDADDSFIELFQTELKKQSNKEMDEKDRDNTVKGNVLVLLTGGTETSRSSLIYLLLAVAENPEQQQKVHEELDRVIGEEGSLFWSERAKVPYTHAAILEAMRWKTLVPISSWRMTTEDTQVQGYDIPKGTFVTFNMYALHHDTNYWSEPEKFIPERFLTTDGKKVNSDAESYAPFSFGKRGCPGKLIANLELFQYFVTFMQKFTVLPSDGDKVHYKCTRGLTFAAYDLKLRFIPRIH